MMIHHSSEDYNVAASAAAAHARVKFDDMIHKGRSSAAATVEHILTTVPQDAVCKAASLRFRPRFCGTDTAGALVIPRTIDMSRDGARWVGLHRNGLNQAAERLGMSTNYVSKLLGIDATEGWKHDLLCHNLHELASRDHRRFLIRTVSTPDGHEARAVLSDKFRRLDTRPILDAFLGAVDKFGALPCEGTATDTKVFLKVVLPHIFEPVSNEPTCFGIQLSNSDFGNGKLSLRGFMLRLACTNKAITEEHLGQVHLGKRLSEDMQFSQKTYQLDTDTMASAVADVAREILAPEKVNARLDMLRLANEKQIVSFNQLGSLKKALTKEEWQKVKDTFEGPDDYNLPPGKTQYRLSNAVSWLAHSVDDRERANELEVLAGGLLAA